jgi:hypothetical protein
MRTKPSLNYNSFIIVWRAVIHVEFYFLIRLLLQKMDHDP